MQGNTTVAQTEARVKTGTSSPITYYFNAAMTLAGEIAYINVYQCLNDKFTGKILQSQFFVVAEQSQRIFVLNRKLIEEAIQEARKKPDFNFVVAISTKWFDKEAQTKELEILLSCFPENLIFSMDTASLARAASTTKEKLNKMIADYDLKLMLDNPEEEKLSMLFDYKISYLRLDGRYYKDQSSMKSAYLRIYADYATAQNIKVVVQHVNDAEEKRFFKIAGLDLMEGKAIAATKTRVVAITAPVELQNK